MSDHQNAFEAMATRGTPIGATALLGRVRADLSGVSRLVDERPQPTRYSGLAVAAAVFAVVIAVGGLFAFLSRQTDNISGDVDAFGIEWIEVPFSGISGGPVAGPGGFVKHAEFGVDAALEFSADGRTWTPVSLSDWPRLSWPRVVVASATTWLVAAENGDEVSNPWVSTDGVAWSQVVWGPEMGAIVADVVSSGDGFLATTNDVFGVGLQYWWSSDAREWSELKGADLGGRGRYRLWGTSAGILAVPDQTGTEDTLVVQRIVDGSTWTEGTIDLPGDMVGGSFRWHLSAVEFFGDQWIAFGEMQRTEADPVLLVWTSPDGVVWAYRGIADFDLESGTAPTSLRVAAVGDVVAAAIDIAPVEAGDSGLRRAGGYAGVPGQIWVSDDGDKWTKAAEMDSRLMWVAGTVTEDGRALGLWLGFSAPTQDDRETSVATTGIVPTPQDIDPDGLSLQDEILADGKVTQEEYTEAMEGWKRCMEERGIERVSYDDVTARGGGGRQWGSPTPDAGEAENAACEASYLARIEETLHDL